MTEGTLYSCVYKTVITFIVPVLNRKQVIVRAITSCLRCTSERIEPRVLVIDGGSTDGTLEIISDIFAHDTRVVKLAQPSDRPGFMNACYFAVEHLDDCGMATFMYSDDILSPQFIRMADALMDAPDVSIVMGYGLQAPEKSVIEFPPILNVDRVEADRVLDAFYGKVERLDDRSLPVSPVCCIVRPCVLKAWVSHVSGFTHVAPLRSYAMIRLAGGPDLMIYLSALALGGRYALRANAVVAQLTDSKDSLSRSGNRANQLSIGYWLARVWCMEELFLQGRHGIASRCSGYLLIVWAFLFIKKIVSRDWSWIWSFICEMLGILSITTRRGRMITVAVSGVLSLWSRMRMLTGIKGKAA
jgi:glycosyltransferase involved in cell wall biosynthesis